MRRGVAPTGEALPDSIRFDRFELQIQERVLYLDGLPTSLGGRAVELLMALAQRPGRLVTKAELLELVWPGLVVEENNLQVQISALPIWLPIIVTSCQNWLPGLAA